eukprot:Skav223431  [mRNA]  locus=scaffold350:518106:521308:+ [translate_table: standard]
MLGFVTSSTSESDQVFVHVKYCIGGQPAVGDEVTFDIEREQLSMGDKPEDEVPKGAFEGVVPWRWRPFREIACFGFIEPAMYRQPVLLRAVDCQREPKVGDKVNFDVEPVKLDRRASLQGPAPLPPTALKHFQQWDWTAQIFLRCRCCCC